MHISGKQQTSLSYVTQQLRTIAIQPIQSNPTETQAIGLCRLDHVPGQLRLCPELTLIFGNFCLKGSVMK
jgi:hypothetical protein